MPLVNTDPGGTRTRTVRGVLLVFFVGVAAALGVLATALPAFAVARNVPDPGTTRTDGRVNAILRVGDTIYMAGNFAHVNGVERKRFAAMDAATGALTDWSPRANAAVYALAASADGSKIYAGGEFTRSNDADRGRLVALDATTGQTVVGWDAAANGPVRSIAVLNNRIYVGGSFSGVNGSKRGRLALVDGTSGSVAPNWRPYANATVNKLVLSGGRLYAGGYFSRISGGRVPHLAALNPYNGALLRWRPRGAQPVIDLVAAGSRVYTAEGGRGGAASAYTTGRGKRVWTAAADGDVQAIAVHRGRLYVGGHFDRLGGKTRVRLAALKPGSGKLNPSWTPRANLGVWELASDAGRKRLYVGGDFTNISGRASLRLARFTG